MSEWEAILSNGEKVVETPGDPSAWRRLMEYARTNRLKVRSLVFEGKEVDDRAESYFIIHDTIQSTQFGKLRLRKGLGSFRNTGKARIQWVMIDGVKEMKKHSDYTEIIPIEQAAIYKELTIEVEKTA